MKRNAFTMIELIMVIVVIGILASMAVPKFTGVKEQAIKSTELATASAIATALEAIHSTWSMSQGNFDWNNDGVDDAIETELAASGYPLDLSRNSDDLGALLKSSSKSGFVKQLDNDAGSIFRIYTGKASDPSRGVDFTSQVDTRDVAGQPDKNDFWIYMVDTNSSNRCYIDSSASGVRQIISGDFVLIDVNGTTPLNFGSGDLGIDFQVNCS